MVGDGGGWGVRRKIVYQCVRVLKMLELDLLRFRFPLGRERRKLSTILFFLPFFKISFLAGDVGKRGGVREPEPSVLQLKIMPLESQEINKKTPSTNFQTRETAARKKRRRFYLRRLTRPRQSFSFDVVVVSQRLSCPGKSCWRRRERQWLRFF